MNSVSRETRVKRVEKGSGQGVEKDSFAQNESNRTRFVSSWNARQGVRNVPRRLRNSPIGAPSAPLASALMVPVWHLGGAGIAAQSHICHSTPAISQNQPTHTSTFSQRSPGLSHAQPNGPNGLNAQNTPRECKDDAA